MKPSRVRIGIADAHELLREGLKLLFSERSGIQVVAEAKNTREALGMAMNPDVDVMLLDLNFSDRGGFDILQAIRHENKALPILIISMYPEAKFALRCLKAGANGYFNKLDSFEELNKGILMLAKGKKYLNPVVVQLLADQLIVNEKQPDHASLSNREMEVFLLIAQGLAVGEIAVMFSLSVKTISTYRTRLLKKLQLRNNAELMRYAIEHDLTC
jgi:DNA-binding NarL/FixJ family response regulator